MANENEPSQPTPNVLGVITIDEHQRLLESGLSTELRHKLGEVGTGDVMVVHDTDEAGFVRSTSIVDAQSGKEMDDETRASAGLGTPAEEKAKLAERDAQRLKRHDRSGFKTPYGGSGSR